MRASAVRSYDPKSASGECLQGMNLVGRELEYLEEFYYNFFLGDYNIATD